jgi:hypothetical protein
MKNLFALLVIGLSPISWAADAPGSLVREVKAACETYAKKSLTSDFMEKRGGTCTASGITVDPSTANRGFVAPMSYVSEVPVIEAYGQITISCSATLFQSAQVFPLKIRLLAGPFSHGPCSVQDKTSFF